MCLDLFLKKFKSVLPCSLYYDMCLTDTYMPPANSLRQQKLLC